MKIFKTLRVCAGVFGSLCLVPQATAAQAPAAPAGALAAGPTYADLATLADAAPLVIRAQIRRQSTLGPERAPGLAPGFARLYIEAQTLALIGGRSGVPVAFAYLVDVPLDPKGKVPKLAKRDMVLFAKPVAGRPNDVQLVAPTAQLAYTPELEARLRPILTELYAAEAPPRVTAVTEALAVPGTLTGESETQIFLATENRSPVSISVLRRPGQRPQWGVSWGEIIDSAAVPPQANTLRWYRLACALPPQLPSSANLSRDPTERRLAATDYAFVREALGPCARRITPG
jgi:hypothetical protein